MNPPNQPTIAPTPRTDSLQAPAPYGNYFSASASDFRDLARILERELADAKAECERFRLCTLKQDGEIARLRAELAVAENWVEHHSKHADDLIGENVRLRADRRWHPMCQTKNPQMSTTQPTEAQYQLAHIIRQSSTQERAAQLIADSEARAVERLKEQLRIKSAASAHALHWAEKAEAERDALAKDKARLDWLAVSDTWFDYPATESFNPETFRDAIDAAMKGTP
jgi:hypothetical protein